MTPERLIACLGALDWTTANLATVAGVSVVTVRRWRSGRVPVPDWVADVLERMVVLAQTMVWRGDRMRPDTLGTGEGKADGGEPPIRCEAGRGEVRPRCRINNR